MAPALALRRRARGPTAGRSRSSSRSADKREGGPVKARLRVNPITCEAHGLCAELLPELIRLDDWGYPIIDEAEVPPELIGLARKAADACPTLALLLDEGD
jgi:ferredoxin